MCEKYALVEHSSAINTIIRNTFQTTQRIKFTAFDVSARFIVFGANSGGIYVFTREPCQFLKLIPSTHGPTNLMRISPCQENLAIAVSTGLVIVIEGCFNPQFEQQVFGEHEGHTVTAMTWNGNDLYCGDSTGRVSVITLKHFLTMFQAPITCLMKLDSQIVQLDAHWKFLLVSTQTRSVLCDTESERYRQIGKKMRDGPFGACFLNQGAIADVAPLSRPWGVFRTVAENEQLSHFVNDDVKIYCARPGLRLWQADFQANVVLTHQFKPALPQKHSDVIQWLDCDQLQLRAFDDRIDGDFNFGKILPLLGRFVLCFRDEGFYIFEPSGGALLHWSSHVKNIKDLRIVDSVLYVWHNDLEVSVVSLLSVEELILRSLVRKKYNLCAELCVKFFDEVESLLPSSKKIHLISALESRLDDPEVVAKLTPIFQSLRRAEKIPTLEKFKNGIVTVNALPMLPESVQNFQVEEVDKKDESLGILAEQFKISKIQKNVETSNFIELVRSLEGQSLHELLVKFQEQTEEDCSLWCREIFLKYVNVSDIPASLLNYARESFFQLNPENFICKCGFPLPETHQTVPKYYETGCQLMEKSDSCDLFLKNVPSMYRFALKDIDSSNVQLKIPLIIQFSDLETLENHSSKMTYDLWDESIRLLLKLKRGQCLNCGSEIEASNSFKWKDFGLLMVESIKPPNAIKLLKRYSNTLPKGEFDQFFYQYCILSAVLDPKSPVLKETLSHENVTKQFEASMGAFLRRQYLRGGDNGLQPCRKPLESNNCDHCRLPLKVAILEHLEKPTCGHVYHKVCFLYNERRCPLCK